MIVLVPVGQFEKSPNIPEGGKWPTIDITFLFFLKCNVAEKLIFFTNDLFYFVVLYEISNMYIGYSATE